MKTQSEPPRSIFFLLPVSLLMGGLIFVARIIEVEIREKSPYLPVLIYDLTFANDKQPYHFRSSNDSLADKTVSHAGLDTLHASGSAQFSDHGLSDILERIGGKKVTIVDLRQASHGFLNGLPIGWWNTLNTDNEGLSMQAAVKIETQRLDNLSAAGQVIVYTAAVDRQNKELLSLQPGTVQVEKVQNEELECKGRGLKYLRVPVTDDHAPDDFAIDQFVTFVRELPAGTWLHFHCDNGHGRTTTFLCMYDMLRNARNVSFDDIVKRQFLLGGVDLTALPAEGNFKRPLAQQRLNVLKRFYQFCKTANPKQTWPDWSEKNPVQN